MKTVIRSALGILSVSMAAILEAMGGWDQLSIALVVAMAIDYVTGLLCAAVWHRSPKSPNGGLESRAGIKGLFRKAGIILCVILAAELSMLVGTTAIRDSTIIFFTCNEALSILENLGIMGVPFPPAIKSALDALSAKPEEQTETGYIDADIEQK